MNSRDAGKHSLYGLTLWPDLLKWKMKEDELSLAASLIFLDLLHGDMYSVSGSNKSYGS